MNELSRPAFAHMTTEEFLLWPGDGSGRKFHLIDGEVRPMSPASSVHGAIQMTFGSLIVQAARRVDSRLLVVSEGAIVPALTALNNVRVPDLVVVRGMARRDEVAIPDPILLVEILSPGNASTTRDNIRAYATLPSVQELVVIHTTRMSAEVHVRDAAGLWPPGPTTIERGGRLRLDSVRLDCIVNEIYANTWMTDPGQPAPGA